MDNIKLDFQKHIDAGRCNGAEWIINYKNKKAHYSLENNRKFNLNHFKALKAKEYVKKIIV